ncbi:MAG TPA: hypothetical protein VG938_05130 [Verrucomicrobiae bacterium]|jgi:hypothetical protein|nr:hypothetical protein [Verrucomicrobiae bacterium]
MIFLVAIFIPPLYFLIKKKWLGLIVSSLLLILSLFLAMTIVLIPGALILWALCSMCAVWNLRKALVNEHAEAIATKMAAKMQTTQKQ